MSNMIPMERIENKIYLIRGQKVMLDRDLAELYGVTTRNLKRQVKRNIDRFPPDFMFVLSEDEIARLVCHFGTPLKSRFGGARPFAFTEHGILMLSSVLHCKKAIEVNIKIMRIFNKIREFSISYTALAEKLSELERQSSKHEVEITTIFKVLRQLMMEPVKPTKRIGFLAERDGK